MNRDLQIKAMASPQRMTILRLLSKPQAYFSHQTSADPVTDGVCMTLIAAALEVTQPTASRHVDILKQAGFITTRRQGAWSYCRRNDDAIRDYLAWLQDTLGAP